uniref:Uncharacterized protein n=1 Tax=Anguilla anguilla TaxID=7936 RepID=A0A0E9PVK9_ANGAN
MLYHFFQFKVKERFGKFCRCYTLYTHEFGFFSGSDSIKASASPLLYTLSEGALKEV